MSQDEREEYYRRKAIEIQKGIVNYKSCNTMTSESFIWTYRTTSVDVLSVITTTVPVTNGAMKDILLKNREIKRLKLAKKSNKADLSCSPFDISLSVDKESKRKRMNNLLLTEQKNFMSKLNASRSVRTQLENKAATQIQTLFRGHLVRITWSEIKHYAEVHKQIRSNIRSYLANKYNLTISMAKYKRTLTNARNKSAVSIQCAYFCYLSRKCLRRRKYEVYLQKRMKAAICIQAMIRGVSARIRVKLLVDKLRVILHNKSVTIIQAYTRRHIAKRKVHRRRYRLYYIASRIIINWYRTRYTRKMAAHIKAMMLYRRTQNGAIAMQCLIRKFLAKRRVKRIRLRRLYKNKFRSVTVIQCIIRRFLCRIRVQNKRLQVNKMKLEAEVSQAKRIAEEIAVKEAEETKLLLESVDLFVQANKGNTTEVVDIYTGLASTDEHGPDDVETGTGDNLLTIAARLGNLDLIRKCLIWGFDLNHRNEMGFNALMIAAKHNQLSVMQYLLAPQVSGVDSTTTPFIPLEPISEEDAGFLLVTAAANAAIGDDLSMLVKVLSLGMDINSKNAATGMTAVHAACEVGHVEAFKLLVKSKADLETEDDLGQTALHKASCNSFKLTEMILGLDPTFSAYMSEATRTASILKVDGDGKDCILHAALNGQSDTLELLTSSAQTGAGKTKSSRSLVDGNASAEEIGWSPNDITKALKLVETGNLICLNKIIDIGFDSAWVEEETGRTLPIVACQSGNLDMIDLIMSYDCDFSVTDVHGRTALHYAAECTTTSVLPHLLMHTSANKCNISDIALLAKDHNGENVFHIAARAGIELKIDLLAQKVLKEALEMRNNKEQTPLLVACATFQLDIVRSYLKLGADALAKDKEGHNSLWYLLHPNSSSDVASSTISTLKTPNNLLRRPLCSEYVLYPTTATSVVIPPLSRTEKDDEIARVTSDVSLFVSLIRAGCTLYTEDKDTTSVYTPDHLRTNLKYRWNEIPTSVSQLTYQCGDIIIQEISLTLLKTLITEGLIRKSDAWKLFLSAIWFDDGSAKVYTALFKAGILDILTLETKPDNANDDSVSNPTTTDSFPLHRLHEYYWNDLTAIGWIIQLNKPKVLQYFVRRGYKTSIFVDSMGNSALHYAILSDTTSNSGNNTSSSDANSNSASSDNTISGSTSSSGDRMEIVDILLNDKTLKLEQTNHNHYTAAMLAAKSHNYPILKRLYEVKADLRCCLNVYYSSWILSLIRKKERNEINTQTGRYGEDDELYFHIKPDPYYTIWYNL